MPQTMVIFGASGDLTSRKLIPALYQLHRKKRLPAGTRIVGFSRTPFTHDAWRAQLAESTAQYLGADFDAATWQAFAAGVFYQTGDLTSDADVTALAKMLTELEQGAEATRIYYLATAPQFYLDTGRRLGRACMVRQGPGGCRIVVEKPFGEDLATARALNDGLHEVFPEGQIYRIDHYLGKETVQNLLVFRFANAIFEPIWNRNFIDHVQITAAEEVPVGRRGSYYDHSGVLRDMFQNHLLQLLTFTAMEAPSRFEADLVRNEKVKVLQAVRPFDPDAVAAATLRAQYQGYRAEPGVAADSQTPTYAAVRLHIDNWRWQGVPFYLRSGKAMNCRTTQIVIQFRDAPHMMFAAGKRRRPDPNRLVIHIQPAEGIQLHFLTKIPDAGMQFRSTDLNFRYGERFATALPDAYERLLLDVMQGDASLFARSDEVELAWSIIDPILAAWTETGAPEMTEYEVGQWGPTAAQKWIWADGREWLDACPVLK